MPQDATVAAGAPVAVESKDAKHADSKDAKDVTAVPQPLGPTSGPSPAKAEALLPQRIVNPAGPANPMYGSNYAATATATAEPTALAPPPLALPLDSPAAPPAAVTAVPDAAQTLPEGWEEVEAEDGRSYFWNFNTDEVRRMDLEPFPLPVLKVQVLSRPIAGVLDVPDRIAPTGWW